MRARLEKPGLPQSRCFPHFLTLLSARLASRPPMPLSPKPAYSPVTLGLHLMLAGPVLPPLECDCFCLGWMWEQCKVSHAHRGCRWWAATWSGFTLPSSHGQRLAQKHCQSREYRLVLGWVNRGSWTGTVFPPTWLQNDDFSVVVCLECWTSNGEIQNQIHA